MLGGEKPSPGGLVEGVCLGVLVVVRGGGAVELIQCNMSDTTPSSAPASLGGLGVGVLVRVQIEQTGSWGPFLLSVFQRGVGWGGWRDLEIALRLGRGGVGWGRSRGGAVPQWGTIEELHSGWE